MSKNQISHHKDLEALFLQAMEAKQFATALKAKIFLMQAISSQTEHHHTAPWENWDDLSDQQLENLIQRLESTLNSSKCDDIFQHQTIEKRTQFPAQN